MGLNPKDLRLDEQIAISYTYDYLSSMQKVEKKDFRFLNENITDAYNHYKEDPEIQRQAIEASNTIEEKENPSLVDDSKKNYNRNDIFER